MRFMNSLPSTVILHCDLAVHHNYLADACTACTLAVVPLRFSQFFDKDQSGAIDPNELSAIMRGLGANLRFVP
jgi:hypothetical protein